MAESEDVNTLKRRGRRRLVGAIALVLLAVIVLPMVFDSEPRSSAPPVSVRIPAEDESGFVPKVTPKGPLQESKAPAAEKPVEKAPEKPADAAPPAAAEKAGDKVPEKAAEKFAEKAAEVPVAKAPEATAPAPKAATKAAPVAVTKAAPKVEAAAKKPAEPAAPKQAAPGEQFIVPAGAYAEPSGVIAKLKGARIPYYTEPIATKQGTVIRVRAGPFSSRDAAEKAQKKLKDLGLKPGNVAARS